VLGLALGRGLLNALHSLSHGRHGLRLLGVFLDQFADVLGGLLVAHQYPSWIASSMILRASSTSWSTRSSVPAASSSIAKAGLIRAASVRIATSLQNRSSSMPVTFPLQRVCCGRPGRLGSPRRLARLRPPGPGRRRPPRLPRPPPRPPDRPARWRPSRRRPCPP